jgi:type VI secretion system protein ImpC
MEIPPLPFKVLALAPFLPESDKPWLAEPLKVDLTSLDSVLEGMGVSLFLPLPKNLCPPGGLTLRFKRMKDFSPEALMENNSFLRNLLEAGAFIQDAGRQGLSAEAMSARLKGWPDLPPELKFETQKETPSSSSSKSIDNILQMVAMPEEGSARRTETLPFMEQVDNHLRQILGRIFADENFRSLESAWRGLQLTLRQGNFGGESSLAIVPVTSATLEETLDSLLLRLVADLPSLILIDLPLDNSPRSSELMEKIGRFAETLLAPALGWIAPKFFHLETWSDLARLPFLPHYLEGAQFAKWRAFRRSAQARWVGVTCNRFLARYPYGKENSPGRVWFEEAQGLWASPVWGAGSLIVQGFKRHGWPTRFTEWKEVRLVDLALHPVEGNRSLPTEAYLAEERIDQFVRGGIIPLVSSYNQDIAFMPLEANVAGNSLRYQLFLSRLTRFLFWCKDHFPSELDPAGVEKNLRAAFSLLWERSGHPAPQKLELSVRQTKPDQPFSVKIALETPRQVLSSGERVELELQW